MDPDELNPAQRAAVLAGDGPHLVIAGAGTGKTRTLVHRLAWLIEQGVPASQIVLLTFTRRAAAEMLERAASLVGPRARGVQGGTFHGYAHSLLRRHARVLGYPENFTVLDRSDAEGLVGLVRAELGLAGGERRFPKRGTLLNLISGAVNRSCTIEALLAEDYPQYRHELVDIEAVAKRYAARKRERGVLDYDDLLVRLAELLSEHDDVRAQIAGACRHVLVDEYQDTNRVQALIAALLASEHDNLMVVGDEAQSIYAFRGATVENILSFPEHFQGAKVTILEQSYRSTPEILHLANGVLDSASRGYDKALWSSLPEGGKPVLVPVVDEHEQAEIVVRQVLALREQGVDLGRQAVLFRSASHANVLEVALSSANIPYRKFGGLKFNEAAHVKDVLALLRLVVNPSDELAWFRVLSWSEGLGAKTAEALSASLVAAGGALDASAYKKRKFYPDLARLVAFLEAARARVDEAGAVVEIAVMWYREGMMPRLYDDAKRRMKDLDALVTLADRRASLAELLAEIALDPVEEAELEPGVVDEEPLTLSTLHSAKGLEWDTVFLLNLADGAFPSAYSIEDDDAIEEERRLLYVGVTRAKRRLLLMQPQFVVTWGPVRAGGGCRLLDDVVGLRARVDVGRPTPPTPPAGTAGSSEAGRERALRALRAFRGS